MVETWETVWVGAKLEQEADNKAQADSRMTNLFMKSINGVWEGLARRMPAKLQTEWERRYQSLRHAPRASGFQLAMI